MRPPSQGSIRCMIYKPRQRVLDEACVLCNGSKTWCDSLAPDRCCQVCDHIAPAATD